MNCFFCCSGKDDLLDAGFALNNIFIFHQKIAFGQRRNLQFFSAIDHRNTSFSRVPNSIIFAARKIFLRCWEKLLPRRSSGFRKRRRGKRVAKPINHRKKIRFFMVKVALGPWARLAIVLENGKFRLGLMARRRSVHPNLQIFNPRAAGFFFLLAEVFSVIQNQHATPFDKNGRPRLLQKGRAHLICFSKSTFYIIFVKY